MIKLKKMLQVHFFLRDGETNLNPEKPLVIYYQMDLYGHDRDTAQSTRIKIPHKFWWAYKKNKLDAPDISKDGRQQWVISSYFESIEINERLHKMREVLKEISNSLQAIGDDEINYKLIRERFDPTTKTIRKKRVPTFLEVLKQYVEHQKSVKKRSEGTITNYGIREKNITSFLTEQYRPGILINEVKYKHIASLLRWMTEQKEPDGSDKFGNDHRNKHATFIKSVLDYAVNAQYLTHNSIGKLDLEYEQEKPPAYLTADLRKKLAECDIKSVEKVKRMALFLMHTGFSFVDYCDLREEHLLGACWKKERGKSGIYSLPPLLPEAADILKVYGNRIENLPRMDLSDFNKELKHLGSFTGITEETVGFDLSSSVFRETFASMMENEYMFPRSTIKFMMGHKTERQLKNYSTVMPGRIMHEMHANISKKKTPILKAYSKFWNSLKTAS